MRYIDRGHVANWRWTVKQGDGNMSTNRSFRISSINNHCWSVNALNMKNSVAFLASSNLSGTTAFIITEHSQKFTKHDCLLHMLNTLMPISLNQITKADEDQTLPLLSFFAYVVDCWGLILFSNVCYKNFPDHTVWHAHNNFR